jgi:alcohol dehydrogenase (NADP+)
MSEVKAYFAANPTCSLTGSSIPSRDLKETVVEVEILYCGVYHSDLHQTRKESHKTTYSCVAGHEYVGLVIGTGSKATNFKVGDLAAVDSLVDSCRTCLTGMKQLQPCCENVPTLTCNNPDLYAGRITYLCYSKSIFTKQDIVLNIVSNMDLSSIALLLYAGITSYSSFCHWNVTKGKKVGVVDLRGLGTWLRSLRMSLALMSCYLLHLHAGRKMDSAWAQMKWVCQ